MSIDHTIQKFIDRPMEYSLTVESGTDKLIAVERKTTGVAVPVLMSLVDFDYFKFRIYNYENGLRAIEMSHVFDERHSSFNIPVNYSTLTPIDTTQESKAYFIELARWAEEKIGTDDYPSRCEFIRRESFYALTYYNPELVDVQFEDLGLSVADLPQCFIKNCVDILSLKPTELQPIIAQLPKSVTNCPKLMMVIEIFKKANESKTENRPLDLSSYSTDILRSLPLELIFSENPHLQSEDNLFFPEDLKKEGSFALKLIGYGYKFHKLHPELLLDEVFLKELVARYPICETIGSSINERSVIKILLDDKPYDVFNLIGSSNFKDAGLEELIDLNPMLLFILPPESVKKKKKQALIKFRSGIDGYLTPAIRYECGRIDQIEARFDLESLGENSQRGRLNRFEYLAQVSGLAGKLMKEKLEGGMPRFYLQLIEKAIEDQMPDFLDKEPILNAIKLASRFNLDSDALINQYHLDRPILLPLGFLVNKKAGHSLSVILWKEHMIIANRGDRMIGQNSLTYFGIDRSKITKNYLQLLAATIIAKSSEAQNAAIYEIMPFLVVDFFSFENKIAIESVLEAKNQNVGNCACASMKAGFHALAFIAQLNHGSTLDEAVKKSKMLSDQLSIKLRTHAESLVRTDLGVFIDAKDNALAINLYFQSRCKNLKKQLKYVDNLVEFAKINEEINLLEKEFGPLINHYRNLEAYVQLQFAIFCHPLCSADQKKLIETHPLVALNIRSITPHYQFFNEPFIKCIGVLLMLAALFGLHQLLKRRSDLEPSIDL